MSTSKEEKKDESLKKYGTAFAKGIGLGLASGIGGPVGLGGAIVGYEIWKTIKENQPEKDTKSAKSTKKNKSSK